MTPTSKSYSVLLLAPRSVFQSRRDSTPQLTCFLQTSTSQTQQPPTKATSPAAQEHDQPPIVTYPEFLTKPRRPPPLVTTTRLLNTLYAAASLSALLYGTGKFVLAPMVEALTDARVDMHRTASDKLAALVTQLEATVSEVPSTFRSKLARTAASEGGEEEGDDDDPAEMFHRDVGTQTSDLPAPPPAGEKTPEWQQQSTRVAALTKSLTELKDGVRSQGDSLVDVKVLVDDFRDSLDGLTFTGRSDFSESFDMYSSARKHEPDDEIRKARDNIRRVKGVLLRSRNFPASTR